MFRPTMIAIALLLPLAIASGPVAAENGPKIERAWSRATPGGARNGVVYLRIESPTDDRLLGADSPVASESELHAHIDDNGVMKMRAIEDGLPVTAGETLEMKPGSVNQVMLMGLKRQLRAGESFPLVLYFERAGARDVIVKVERLGAMGPSDNAGMDHTAMSHGAMDQNAMDAEAMGHGAMGHGAMDHGTMNHGALHQDGHHMAETPGS